MRLPQLPICTKSTLEEIVDGKSVPTIGSGLLEIWAEQSDEPTLIPLGRTLQVTELERDLMATGGTNERSHS